VEAYAQRIGATDIAALLRSRGLYYDMPHRTGVTQAGWLLFGHVPPVWSYIRYLRYVGSGVETGVRSNLTDDVLLVGTIPLLIEQAKALIHDKIESVIRLAPSGRFERMPALPEFAWLEAVVNAVTHRSYSIQGDGIRVTQFDDRLEVESPGRLPGLVRVQNIRNSRFSRNPHIARVLAEMTGYVRELNEGVKRMFEEMERYGLRPPVYTVTEGSVKVALYKQAEEGSLEERSLALLTGLRKRLGDGRLRLLLTTLKANGAMSSRDIAELLGVTPPTARSYLHVLEDMGLVEQRQTSLRDPTTAWAVTASPFWSGSSSF
jgi:ATP-dependent DNA helicase RecG